MPIATVPSAARLDRLYDLADSRRVTSEVATRSVMLATLSTLVDDETWDEALARVDQVTL